MIDDDLVCGVTIDVTPHYPDREVCRSYRAALLRGAEALPAFAAALGRVGADSLSKMLQTEITEPLTCKVSSTVDLVHFDEPDDYRDIFCVEIDVLGSPDIYEDVSDVVGDESMMSRIAVLLQKTAKAYVLQTFGLSKCKWTAEVSEYGE